MTKSPQTILSRMYPIPGLPRRMCVACPSETHATMMPMPTTLCVLEEILAGEAVKTFPLSLVMIKSSISFLAGTLSFSRIRNLQSLCKRSSLCTLVVQAVEDRGG